jgi:hypothetical protein
MNTENAKQLISQFFHQNSKYLQLYLSFLMNETLLLTPLTVFRVLILYCCINEALESRIVAVTRIRSLYLQASFNLPDLLHKRLGRRGQAFLTLQSPLFTLHSTMFQIKYFNILLTEYIYVICMNLEITVIIFMTGFYNRKGVCLLCGTSWFCKYNSG